MELIDTHSHIYEKEEFGNDMNELIDRLKENHVIHVILPNIDSKSIEEVIEMENRDKKIFRSLNGLHPENVNNEYKTELDKIMSMMEKHKFVGIGEIGMDLYWDQTYKEEQKEVFETQVAYGVEKDMPIIIHSRNAFEETIGILKKFDKKKIRGIFHSFTGTVEEAEKIKGCGDFKLGINGIVTFKKSTELQKAIEDIDIKDIVLETDSPYLTPVPHRGKRNESSYIKYVAEKIAEIKKMEIEKVSEETTKTAKELFNL